MTIPSERFKLHSDDTNLGVTDLGVTNASELLNSANNKIVDATDSVRGLIASDLAPAVGAIKDKLAVAKDTINGIKGKVDEGRAALKSARDQVQSSINTVRGTVKGVKDTINSYKDAVNGLIASGKASIDSVKSDLKALEDEIVNDPLVREAKGIYGDLRDLSKMSKSDIEDAIMASVFKNDPKVRAAFSKLATKCSTSASNIKGIGKPYDAKVTCNGKDKTAKQGCETATVTDIVDKVTNGQVKAIHKDANATLTGIVALSKMSYDFGICGVFGALVGEALNDKIGGHGLASKAGAAVLGAIVGKDKLNAVMDLAKAQATYGHSTSSMLPTAGSEVLRDLHITGQYRETELPELSNAVKESVQELENKTGRSGNDPLYSSFELDTYTDDYMRLQKAGAMKQVELEYIDTPVEPSDYLLSLSQSQAGNYQDQDVTSMEFGILPSGNDLKLDQYARHPF